MIPRRVYQPSTDASAADRSSSGGWQPLPTPHLIAPDAISYRCRYATRCALTLSPSESRLPLRICWSGVAESVCSPASPNLRQARTSSRAVRGGHKRGVKSVAVALTSRRPYHPPRSTCTLDCQLARSSQQAQGRSHPRGRSPVSTRACTPSSPLLEAVQGWPARVHTRTSRHWFHNQRVSLSHVMSSLTPFLRDAGFRPP